jgi:hypothetical protein
MTLSRQTIQLAGIAAAALTAALLAVANFAGSTENGGGVEYAVTLGISLAVAAVLFGLAIPRVERPARAGSIAGVLAVLSVAVFWSGLPYALGPAAIVLGLLGPARDESRTEGGAAVALGTLATVGGVAALIADQLL